MTLSDQATTSRLAGDRSRPRWGRGADGIAPASHPVYLYDSTSARRRSCSRRRGVNGASPVVRVADQCRSLIARRPELQRLPAAAAATVDRWQ